MENIKRILIGSLCLIGMFIVVIPAKAFYFEMPKSFQSAVESIKASIPTFAVSTKAQEVLPNTGEALQPITVQPILVNPEPQPENKAPQSPTCMVNGVNQPGSCEQWNQKPPEMQSGDKMNFQPQDQQMPQQNNGNEQEREKMNAENNARMMKDIQRGAKDIQKQLKQFELMIVKVEKKGVVVSAETKAKVEELKGIVAKSLNVKAEELVDFDMNEMWEKMRDLEEERRSLEQMDNILREMKRIESNIKMFEKQIQKLVKQKIAVPPTVTESMDKVKSAIADIKAGKMENAEGIFELVQNLDENRNEMEMLARWPQTIKEVDRQVRNLDTQLKQAKTTTVRLTKKGIDVTTILAQFEAGVIKMKQVRDEAKLKIQESAEDAFEMIQNDFFGQMEDIMENHKTIMTMANFGQFQTDFNREINNATQKIKSLKKQKIDVTGLEDLLAQAKEKGAEVKALFKVKPLDVDVVIDALSEVENLGQEFDAMVSELTGVEMNMPWEKGPQQFQQIQVSPNLDKWIPRQTQTNSVEAKAVQTCNVNGLETPGPCQQ